MFTYLKLKRCAEHNNLKLPIYRHKHDMFKDSKR